ncbi:MAG: 4-alpha-glucanotransferase [Planctomycetes bacterium]|nr:4-alpha-glucanotransferase [Planctomycetota bacterium]
MVGPRTAGILLHPTSLPGRYGIGELGTEAHDWLAALSRMRQRLWQVLPLGPTGYGDSPYQSLSTFAGNTLVVSFDRLRDAGLLDADAVDAFPRFPDDRVDFGAVIPARRTILHRAAERFVRAAPDGLRRAAAAFAERERGWLDDWCLFAALKEHFDGRPWVEWPEDLARRDRAALGLAAARLAGAIERERLLQFFFHEHWEAIRDAARSRAIAIVGDLPIFVAHDSADVWCHPELFHLDAAGRPTVVAGVPPDYFCEDGQLWGNPLYRWEAHAADGFAWWIERLRGAFSRFDALRVDHFRGFAAAWEIPATAPTAATGRWVEAPGRELFAVARRVLGDRPIIAEDLGLITPDVEELRQELGFPGMRVLQFGFGDPLGPDDPPADDDPADRVVYTGTHDNDTARGWYDSPPDANPARPADAVERERHRARVRLASDGSEIHWDLIRMALGSRARAALYPLQDVLGLGSEARMNTPGRAWGNWAWRFRGEQLTAAIEERLARLTVAAGRC